MADRKRIGLLTSGGDCAGLNAVIRAVVYAAHERGWEVIGFEDGTDGVLEDPKRVRTLTPDMFGGPVMRLGGTILGSTTKGNPYEKEDKFIQGVKDLGLDAIIAIGGDGSFAILRRIAKKGGFNMVGIPKTIDNDIGMTEVSVGFDTAVYVATEAIDRLQPTAASHDRVMVLEVMGRDAGHIALTAGIAGGADVILIPEIPYTIENIARRIKEVEAEEGRSFALVVVSEAVKMEDGQPIKQSFAGGKASYGGIGHYIGGRIAEATGHDTRVTILGHVQRGSSPIPGDRLIASAFGVHAVDLVADGKFDRMVAWQNRQVIDVPLEDAISSYQQVDVNGTLVHTARALGISLGDG